MENELPGYRELLHALQPGDVPVIGVTGPPGAGKSTLINSLIRHYTGQGLRLAVVAVDPSSPFNFGSLLGDRVRMAEHYLNPNVFIRSLASRGSLGGLSAKTIEVSDLLRAAGFDLIIIETVGVGQSEVEIAGLADCTLVVLVPEAGDEVQALKSGVMEIGDVFVVNKADRPGAKEFINNLKRLLPQRQGHISKAPIVPTVAARGEGLPELAEAIQYTLHHVRHPRERSLLLAEKCWKIIQYERMQGLSKTALAEEIFKHLEGGSPVNIYQMAERYR